jgi:hypothetical protein
LTLFSLLLSNNSISPFIDDFGFAFDFDSILLLDCDLFFPFFHKLVVIFVKSFKRIETIVHTP